MNDGRILQGEFIAPSVTSSSLERKASILHEGEEDSLHPRKVSTSNTENRAPGESLPEIKPTQTYASAQTDPLPIAPKEERRPISRDSDRKDDVEDSRPSYRDPDFEKEPPPRRSDPVRRRFDDKDEYYGRGSPSRYDERDRGRDTDDRYSKGDTRVYPDERTILDDKYPQRDSDRPRGDDRDREDRYRDREDRYRDRVDRDREDRYRDKEDRPRNYDDRYRDKEDRPRDYDDRYRDKEDRPRDYDDRYRDKEDRHRDYDDRYRDKEDRPRDYDDRYKDREGRPRDYDDRYRERDRPYLDDERNRKRDDRYNDRYISRSDSYIPKYTDDDDRSRERPYYDRRDRDDEYRYTLSREKEYRKPIMSSRDELPSDRKSGRPEDTRRPPGYEASIRDRPTTSYRDESSTIDRYPSRGDEYVRSLKYDNRERISPSRTREEAYISRSSEPSSRSRDDAYESRSSIIDVRNRDDDRYSSIRDRSRYYDDDIRRVDESRYISPSSVPETDSTRRDFNRDGYRTRSPDDKKLDDVDLERRSYSEEEEEEEYRRQNSRTRHREDTDRIPSEGSRRDYRPDDDYSRRRTDDDDDEYRRSRPRGDHNTDIARGSDRYDRPIDDDDRPSRRYPPEKDEPRRRTYADVGPRKESYPRDVMDEDRTLLRPPAKDRRYDEDIPPRRKIYDGTIDDRPPIDRAQEDGRRRYRDDVTSIPDDSPRRAPLRSKKRESFVGSSASSRDAVVREKIYPNSGRRSDDSGIEERPVNAKDVIEAALKLPDVPRQNPREVLYPVYVPRSPNLTATDAIPRNAWRGTTTALRRRRSRPNH